MAVVLKYFCLLGVPRFVLTTCFSRAASDGGIW